MTRHPARRLRDHLPRPGHRLGRDPGHGGHHPGGVAAAGHLPDRVELLGHRRGPAGRLGHPDQRDLVRGAVGEGTSGGRPTPSTWPPRPSPVTATVSAHVTAQQNTSAWAKAGVMLRATTDPGSPYYAAFVTPGQGHRRPVARRPRPASSSQVSVAGTVPVYLRVGRYTSGADHHLQRLHLDGRDHLDPGRPARPMSLALPQPLLAGLAITSHSQGTGSAVTLDTVSVTPGSSPAVLPQLPDRLELLGHRGGQSHRRARPPAATTWTLPAGGPDIWGTADAFHYAWQTLAANGSVSGQMSPRWRPPIRGPRPGSWSGPPPTRARPYYAVYVTKGNGVVVQERHRPGRQRPSSWPARPARPRPYVEVTRTGTVFDRRHLDRRDHLDRGPGSSATLANLTGVAAGRGRRHLTLAPASATVGFSALTVTGS